ncbi:hypothetical protein CJU73_02765 [Pseudomonas fragi]|uniref:NEL-type E3 ubiquitin ligase domain-containing protein n=1 Tax=Pseudomonas fragi TaxID=296 RepID=UPI000BA22063|nr:NEL-type E3 ubiquitin ligase domain-containing protein [Pseudomonas fragi]PAA31962.1 hypothetical protein CJU73_02765 [Pseudomonas fragi]
MDNLHSPAESGPYDTFISNKMPAWVKHTVADDIKRLKPGLFPGYTAPADADNRFARAPSWQVQALLASQLRSRAANQALALALGHLQGITQFAEPRLQEALHSHQGLGRAMDINSDRLFYLRRDRPVQQQTLLQAALSNFEGNEDFNQRVAGQVSALAPPGALPVERFVPQTGPDYPAMLADTLVHGSSWPVDKVKQELDNLNPVPGFSYQQTLPMSPEVFSQICRALDLGEQYQAHLNEVFAPRAVRSLMIRAQIELLAVRLHTALIQGHVSQAAHTLVMALLQRERDPQLYGKPVVFSRLQIYGMTLDEVLVIGPYRSRWPVLEWEHTGLEGVPLVKKPGMEPVLVYIPGALVAPLKEYPSFEAFQYELGLNLRDPACRQLIASLVPQGSAGAFTARLNQHVYQTGPDPAGQVPPVYVDEVDLKLALVGIDTPAHELFTTLNHQHLARLKANARVLAVPTADADSKFLQERLEYYLGIGLDALNVAAFFIPGAGEVMMAVMALQMGMDVYHGIEAWNVGDVQQAWSHMESIALNIGVGAVIGAAGHVISAGLANATARWGEGLVPIVLPDGQTRLWRPELEPYRCAESFDPQVEPNALGQYRLGDKTYVRIDPHFYEQVYDPKLDAWRVRHPVDDSAYQPLLKHNHAGAWRHSHEQPLQWQRLTLLRRLGHETRFFDDKALVQIGDVSGVTDEALRRVHMDGLPVPALLQDTLAQFRAAREPGGRASGARGAAVDSGGPDLERLRRRFPMLTGNAAREVLGYASASDLARLRLTGQGSRELDDLARYYAQQARLNRALAGLFVPELASVDSERLAIEARLHVSGLQDSAQDEALAAYATSHRNEMAGALHMRPIRARPGWQRLNGKVGYALSGRGAGVEVNPSLISRVRDISPDLSDEQAEAFVRQRMASAQTDRQIFDFLATRQRELDTLRATLENWASAANGPLNQRVRRLTADRLVSCWRQGLQRSEQPFAYLDLGFDLSAAGDFPVLEADFSHVRTLKLSADLLLSEPEGGLVKRFGAVRSLELSMEQGQMPGVADALTQLPAVTQLSLEASWQGFSRAFVARLEGLARLESLTFKGTVGTLDASGWPQLRLLRVSGRLEHWPAGVLELAHLETLDLFGTSLKTLPEALFAGHQRLWPGLLLDWSGIEARTAMKAWEYLRGNPASGVDMHKWSSAYCSGCLTRFMPEDRLFARSVMDRLAQGESAVTQLLERVNGLQAEHQALTEGINAWINLEPASADTLFRRQAGEKLHRCWRDGIKPRLELEEPAAGPSWRTTPSVQTLDLTVDPVRDLPVLPGKAAFAHVHGLNLSELRLGVETLERFLASFEFVRELNLSRNGLSSLPQALGEMRQLTGLNLAYNDLTITPVLQARLNALARLERLDLQGNRVTVLDVSTMTRLESLDLSHTGIKSWPTGVLELPRLRQLDLSSSAVRTVPDALFSGHDGLLQGTRLNGCSLTAQSCADLLAYGRRTGSDRVGNIATGLLAAGRTGGSPEYFPVLVSDQPDLLLADGPVFSPDEVVPGPAPVFEPGNPSSSRTALLQQVNPDLSLHDAVACLDRWQAEGMAVLDIDARLGELHRQHQVLVQRLNDWINTPGHREGGRWISAVDRRRAADRLMGVWRQGVTAARGEEGQTLDFSDLCLGDIPALSVVQEHVTTLNLSGARITARGSQAFICEFPALRNLHLNNNQLSRLPEGLGSLQNLSRLEASRNHLQAEDSYDPLRSLAHLQWLDLSYNRLASFDLSGMNQLQTLNLQGNRLVRWPARALTTPTLTTLNLSGNQIENIPVELFEGDNDELMAHTDLSNNPLSAAGYETLRDYIDFSGNHMGLSPEDIDDGLAYTDNSSDSDYDQAPAPVVNDENLDHLDDLTPAQVAQQKARWLQGVAQDSPLQGIWDGLWARSEARGLFYLLDQLQFTQDFIQDRAGLTQRVLDVLQAAASDTRLCDELFVMGRSDVTCGDGRILLFSDLEVKVYEFNALKSVVAGQEGPALLDLTRRLFRLGQLEDIAQMVCLNRRGADIAEVRLAYRISLGKRLDLPSQPKDMLYRRAAKVSALDIESAYLRIKAAESSPAFMTQLLEQDYWTSYLQRQYPQAFVELEQRFAQEHKALEERHADLGEDYERDINALDEEKKSEERQLRERLTEQAISSHEAA